MTMNKFIIVGLGGTGSWLVPPLLRMLNSPNFNRPEVVLIDHDTVERKNTERQNFIDKDIGKSKVSALADRYSKYFPLVDISRNRCDVREYFDHNHDRYIPIIISCVDSVESRKDILKSLILDDHGYQKAILIDSGNEDQYGHVTISFFDKNDFSVTTDTFMDVIKGNVQVIQGSCVTLGEQTLIQNHVQASMILKMLLNLTNIITSVVGKILLGNRHPLVQISEFVFDSVKKEFSKNKLLISTYNTGGMSSKHDVKVLKSISDLYPL